VRTVGGGQRPHAARLDAEALEDGLGGIERSTHGQERAARLFGRLRAHVLAHGVIDEPAPLELAARLDPALLRARPPLFGLAHAAS
jgi:hypothetical protein